MVTVATWVVKQVVSGDTLVLSRAERRPDGPPDTRTVTLAGIVAPRLALKSQNIETQDEPFAFAAREALRKQILGEVLRFDVVSRDREREFVHATCHDTDMAVSQVRQGLAKVKSAQATQSLPNYSALKDAENAARDERKAVWSDSPAAQAEAVRRIRWLQNDVEAAKLFAQTHAKQKLPAIVEYVRDGGSLRLYFPTLETAASVNLSGVIVDRWRRVEGYAEPTAEPFAEEARYFVEVRLLGREVQFQVEGADSSGSLTGSVLHPKGNIALALLRNGFARIHEGSVAGTQAAPAYKQAQREAQSAQVRKWRDFFPSETAAAREWIGTVIEVLSGDCVLALCEDPVSSELDEKRIYIASVRAPRLATRSRPGEPWAWEAKEFARKALVGKQVQITCVYVRDPIVPPNGGVSPPTSDAGGKLFFCTVLPLKRGTKQPSGEDFALQAVKAGFCRVAPHRNDDPRALNYAMLVEAEAEAASQRIGVHSLVAPKSQLNDLAGPSNTNKAKGWEPTFLRAGVLDGWIDHAFHAGRFKLIVPQENVSMSFILSGIQAPQPARPATNGQRARPADLYAEDALQFVRQRFLQRNVTFKVEACDRGGNFIGVMWCGPNCVNTELVKRGYATLSSMVPPSLRTELSAALTEAQEKLAGMWAAGVPFEDDAAASPDGSLNLLNEVLGPVVVSYVGDCRDIFVQDKPADEVEALQAKIKEHVTKLTDAARLADQFGSVVFPRNGEIVLAQFSDDQAWYRAKVTEVRRQKRQVTLTYIDFGNSETRDIAFLLRCPSDIANSPVLGRRCSLSGVLPPLDMLEEGAQALMDLLLTGEKFHCTVETVEHLNGGSKRFFVQLTPLSENNQLSEMTVAEILLQEGNAIVDRKAVTELLPKLLAAERLAKEGHLNVWRHGDVGAYDSDPDDFLRARAVARRR